MNRYVVELDSITKAFKKHSKRHQFLTLKSTLIRDLWKLKQKNTEVDPGLFWALKGVDVRIRKGETIGFIGSNGSGKSTVLKIIAGILKPTTGRVSVTGRLSALIELGAGFHPEISGRENIFINGIMLGLTKQQIREKFDEIVDFADLRDFIDNPVRTYSSGMFMRLGFAVAVHVNPDILLIDEVLAVGDQTFVHKCLERIFDFKRRGKTIIVVTHDLGAVEKLCSRAVWLSQGIQKSEGPAREIIGAYLLSVARKEEERYATEHEQIQEALDRQVQDDAKSECDQGESPVEIIPIGGEQTGKRWGNRKIEITRFRILDATEHERYLFLTGEDVLFEIQYQAKETISAVVFGVGFYLQDGTWCYGSNTDIERYTINVEEGTGKIRIRFPQLNLIQNTYLIDVAVHGVDSSPYDFHSRMYRIAFRSNQGESGIFRPDHDWTFHGPGLDVKQIGDPIRMSLLDSNDEMEESGETK
ncbi:ABC transporter ATP-binding protein [bacterium]|nr:ABC transporter ATP-binding protein [candidate division CSSED10-310 bacterium]